MQDNTNHEYDGATACCRDIFINKTKDYGTSWRVYRTISVADQIYIKARRIRTVQENRDQKIDDHVLDEFKGILNYAIIGLIQLDINNDEPEDLPVDIAEKMYDEKVIIAKKLMQDKNHDYDEAWREMSRESFTDLILAKVLRIKKIISNDGKTLMSEGIEANLFDIINYAAFALILSE
jgi:Nucleotide modification associated domain 1